MDIDWTRIRGALSRIEKQLSKAREVIKSSDEEAYHDWPVVTRSQLEAAFPNWRTDYGDNWLRDFMEKKVGRENFRARQGSRKYRIAPDRWQELQLAARRDTQDSESLETRPPSDP